MGNFPAPPRRPLAATSIDPEVFPPADDTGGVRAGGFQGSPAWDNDGSGLQSAIDDSAQQGIEQRHARAFQAIDAADQSRGDPMERAIHAEEQRNRYEAARPYGSESSIHATYAGEHPLAGSEIGSDAIGDKPEGVPSVGTALAIRRAMELERAKQFPDIFKAQQEREAAREGHGDELRRGHVFDEMEALRGDLEADVRTGRRTHEEAAAFYKQKLDEANGLAGLARAGNAPVDPFAVIESAKR